jgi:large subunit ribosomal protein L29
MPSKRSIELQSLSLEQLDKEVSELRDNLSKMKFEHAVRGLQNPKEIKNAKKEIARLLTEVRSREISAMTKEQIAKRSRIRLRRRLK